MTRHTVMVVGQTGGGKSVILQTLGRAQTKMGKRTTMSILNPKVNLALGLTSSPSSQGLSAILLHHKRLYVIGPHESASCIWCCKLLGMFYGCVLGIKE